MSIIDRARRLRKVIESLAVTLDDEHALANTELFPLWEQGTSYVIGDRVRYDGILYKCVQDHTAQSDWTPDNSISLWAVVLIPDPVVIPEWVQPESTNPYMKGDKVRHNGKVWESDIDYNVYEPGVAGWHEIVEGGA